MALNRTIYFAGLSGAVALYLVQKGSWASWALLFFLLAAPVVSLLCSLPQMLSVRLELTAPESVEQGERVLVWVGTRMLSWLPQPEIRMQLHKMATGDVRAEKHFLTRLPRKGGTLWLNTGKPGMLRCCGVRVRVYDYLGLIWLPRRKPAPTETAVLPKPKEPKPRPDLSIFASRRLQQLPQGSFSELHDYRPYRPGDNVRAIHWKLSQKSDELIVREPVEPVRLRCVVALSPVQTDVQLGSVLAQLRWVSGWLVEQQIAHSVLWQDADRVVLHDVSSEDEALSALIEACRMPMLSQPPAPVSFDADWSCRIVPETEVRP